MGDRARVGGILRLLHASGAVIRIVDATEVANEAVEMMTQHRSVEEIGRVLDAAVMRSALEVAAQVTIVRDGAGAETVGVLRLVMDVVVVMTAVVVVEAAVRAHEQIDMTNHVTRTSEIQV